MGWYHAMAAEQGDKPRIVYHLCPKNDWDKNKTIYYPKAYDNDKFTHSMHEPSRLVETANCFYRTDESEWICLEIDTMGLKVNGIEIEMVKSETNPELVCPHIFGGVPTEAVKNVYPVERQRETGEFLSVRGLTGKGCGCNGG